MKRKMVAVLVAGAGLTGGVLGSTGPASASTVQAASVTLNQKWSRSFPDRGSPIAVSSPIPVTLQGIPAVVVGARSGNLYGLDLADGRDVPGWPVHTGVGIDAAPSTDGGSVFVGEGLQGAAMATGGYAAYSETGGREWYRTIAAAPGQTQTAGVASGLAVGNLAGSNDVVSGSMGQLADAFTTGGAQLPGWPFLDSDSSVATPAIADLYGNGRNEIVEGADQAGGVALDQLGRQYTNGGHIRVISGNGTLLCEHNTNQIVRSSPAVGEFLANHGVGIVAGTGDYQQYLGGSDTYRVMATDSHCNLRWETGPLDGFTNSSPALVDALGGGGLEVAIGTYSNNLGSGSLYLLNGATGATIWRTPLLGGMLGSPVSVDLGGGHQDLVVGTTHGAEILDGPTGQVVWAGLQQVVNFQNTPLVTRDPNGSIGITFAGYNGGGSEVVHYEVPGSNGATVSEAGSWPMFHHDPRLSGDAGTPAPVINVPCKAPSEPAGYRLAASDGGIFDYGNLPFCGSTGSIVLNAPVVGIADTPDGGGYWLAARDGGVFAFGDAHYYGSAAALGIKKPIVGIAATPTGHGYWLVASDGGIFTYGDAGFHGSAGSLPLVRPVVGMAPTFDGRGYWLVASDGGIFTYGDAHFYGSAGSLPLKRPVVGMAATPTGHGYWLVASDGGIFTYGDAPFHGSAGSLPLVRPVVGMAATSDGHGYWLVASDGGIFTYGDAPFHGSAGSLPLVRPVVGMSR